MARSTAHAGGNLIGHRFALEQSEAGIRSIVTDAASPVVAMTEHLLNWSFDNAADGGGLARVSQFSLNSLVIGGLHLAHGHQTVRELEFRGVQPLSDSVALRHCECLFDQLAGLG